jgi:hypothetical protein
MTDLDQIREIVLDAASDGLLGDLTPDAIRDELDLLSPGKREDYLQTLWDEL